MNKLVSIIVPVYNADKYLEKSLNSIINQTYKNLEIIVIDDASTDKSVSIIKKYASTDNRIRPIYSEINQGVSISRNIGLKIFTGDYVFFMDADDYIEKDMIKVLVDSSIKYNSDYVDSYELVVYKDKNMHYFTEGKVPKKNIIMGNLKDNIGVLNKYTYVKGKLFTRELVSNVTFNENLRRYEDLVFEHNLKLKVKNMIFLDKVLYHYNQLETSLINTLGEKHYCYLDASKEVISIYKNSDEEIRFKIEAILFTNAFLTGITKIVKNNNSIEENTNLLYKYFNEFPNIFETYNKNKHINKFIKYYYNKIKDNKNKIRNLIKKTKKINFIKIYFKYLSIKYKFDFKN